MAPKKKVAKKPAKKTKVELMTTSDFVDKVDYEGGLIEALLVYGLDPYQYDLGDGVAERIEDLVLKMREPLRELNSIYWDLELKRDVSTDEEW